jgi:hypothetical protein
MSKVVFYMDRNEYKNQFNKEKYDRFNLVLPKGQKEVLKELCDSIGMSVNEYVRLLIQEDIKSGQSKLKEKMSGFTEEQRQMMDKWQIPEKYRDMIQDFHFSKEDGYFIRLKKGFINDVTCSRIIHVEKLKDVRLTINKSHKERV